MTTAVKRHNFLNRLFGRGGGQAIARSTPTRPTFNDAQRSYLVDCGMAPDASDDEVVRFAMHIDDFARAELESFGDGPPVGQADGDGGQGGIERGDGSGGGQGANSPSPGNPAPGQPTGGSTGGKITSIVRAEPLLTGNPGDTITRVEVDELLRGEFQRRDAAHDERCRIIREFDGEDIPRDLVSRAHSERWEPEQIYREFLGAVRARPNPVGRAPAGHVHGREQRQTLQALQGAMLLREGIALDEDFLRTQQAAAMLRGVRVGHSDASWITRMARDGDLRGGDDDRQREVLLRSRDAAHQFAGTHLVDICRMSLEIAGQHVGRHESHEHIVRTALSTAQLQAVFSTSVNMQILQSYMAKPDTTRGWTYDADVNGFHIQQRGRLTKGKGVTKLARGGTPSDITFSDETENYAVERYAGRFVIDEQDIFDNVLGGIQEHTTRELGELLAEIRINLIYGLLLSNPNMRDGNPLFSAAHNNTATGLAFGTDTYRIVKKAMATQTENGRPIMSNLAHIIAPEELDFTVRQILNSSELRTADSAAGMVGTNNPHQNTATPHFDQRLDNGVVNPADETMYTGSTSTWYGASNNGRAGIEVGYRRGSGRAPRIEGGMMPVTEGYGLIYRGNIDIGVKAIDWRGLYRAVA